MLLRKEAVLSTFRIGINMAGAVSAGAYTAGVLDFLTEALDKWYKAKARGEVVPPHDVSLEVLSGASAGGMCAAISAVMLQEGFDHIHDTSRRNTNNRFYESWVNRIDIKELLKTDDLPTGSPVVSLLDSSIIRSIAEYALTPGVAGTGARRWLSPSLTLFLSLTNLRGTPYSLNGVAPGSIEETTFFFGDRIRFQTGSSAGVAPHAHALDFAQPGAAGGWDVLQIAAMATGAFPVFLAPRVLGRHLGEYTPPPWESVAAAVTGTPPPVSPTFPPGTPDPLRTLNVDGGVTNNDPFNYAHDYLAALSPARLSGPPTSPVEADRAVIGVAPFPSTEKFDTAFDPVRSSGVFSVLGRLFSALISQSRFFGEHLDLVMSGRTFDRFVIAPSDDSLAQRYAGLHPGAQPPALQCAALSAFGGFFFRGFRAHDYALGRRNCQKFLATSFLLPQDNAVMKAALDPLPPAMRGEIVAKFGKPAPRAYDRSAMPQPSSPAADFWLPVVPLCTSELAAPIPRIDRAVMTAADLDPILDLILGRFKAVVAALLATVSSKPLRFFLTAGQPAIRFLLRRPLRDKLISELGDAYKP